MDEKTKQRIEEEEAKEARINSAFLEPENTESAIRSIEKAAGFSIGFAILGIAVRTVIKILPIPSGLLIRIVSLVGTGMLGIAVILAIVALVYVFLYRKKTEFKFTNIIITAVATLAIAIIYVVLNFTMIIGEFMV